MPRTIECYFKLVASHEEMGYHKVRHEVFYSFDHGYCQPFNNGGCQ